MNYGRLDLPNTMTICLHELGVKNVAVFFMSKEKNCRAYKANLNEEIILCLLDNSWIF